MLLGPPIQVSTIKMVILGLIVSLITTLSHVTGRINVVGPVSSMNRKSKELVMTIEVMSCRILMLSLGPCNNRSCNFREKKKKKVGEQSYYKWQTITLEIVRLGSTSKIFN